MLKHLLDFVLIDGPKPECLDAAVLLNDYTMGVSKLSHLFEAMQVNLRLSVLMCVNIEAIC